MADQDQAATETPPLARPQRTCKCGHAIGHPQVTPEPKYGVGGWFLLILGATPKPTHAVFKCNRCGMVLGFTRDDRVLREFS